MQTVKTYVTMIDSYCRMDDHFEEKTSKTDLSDHYSTSHMKTTEELSRQKECLVQILGRM